MFLNTFLSIFYYFYCHIYVKNRKEDEERKESTVNKGGWKGGDRKKE
jgi:hypothetical protein